MDRFLEIIVSFPTVVFTVLLLFAIFYWLLALLGLLDIDAVDLDLPDGDGLSAVDVLSGLLLRLGLNGVPVTIVASLIALLGWMLSFTAVFFIYPWLPGVWLKWLVGLPLLVAVLYVSALLTARLIKPLRPLFRAANQQVQKQILGQVAIVRTGQVNRTFGEATLDDGGAGLIVKVRTYKDEIFNRGTRVVLLEHNAVENTYKVVSEDDFNNNP